MVKEITILPQEEGYGWEVYIDNERVSPGLEVALIGATLPPSSSAYLELSADATVRDLLDSL